MDQEKLRALEEAIEKDYGNTVGIVVRKDGKTRYERYFHEFTAGDAVHVASVTKSVLSAVIGIAIGHGHIQSVEEKVLDFFPDYAVRHGERHMQDVTLRHLLTMTAPYNLPEEPYEAFFESDNWVQFALDTLGGQAPAGAFRYAPIVGPHILSGILASATCQYVLDYAVEHLFAPLGIPMRRVAFQSAEEQLAWYQQGRYDRGWVVDPQGLPAASWGLTLTPGDMAKIGQLTLDGGLWDGRQIVPAAWVAESTRAHSHWAAMGLSYGYLWWVLDEHTYAAMGDGGNVIYVNTKENLVVAIAALYMPEAGDRIGLIRERVEPLFAI